MKYLCEIFSMINSAAMIIEKYDFNFEKALRFKAGWQDALSAYKELYNRKMHEAKRLSICHISSLPHQVTADDKPHLLTSRQADIEGIDIMDPPALMDLEDSEMSIDNPFPLFLYPVSCTSTTPTSDDSLARHHHHFSAFQCACCYPSPGK